MRRIRFGLKRVFTLIALVGVAFAVCFWVASYSQMRSARWEYKRVFAARDAGLATTVDVCAASKAWLDCELRMPFANDARACASHVYRVAKDMRGEEAIHRGGYFSDGGKYHEEMIERIRSEYYRPAIDQLREQGGSDYADRVERAVREKAVDLPEP